jgi:hypothetical protein
LYVPLPFAALGTLSKQQSYAVEYTGIAHAVWPLVSIFQAVTRSTKDSLLIEKAGAEAL